MPLAGIDVVEVSPPYDHAEVTAFLANRVVLEALSGIAWRRSRAAGRSRCANPARRCSRVETHLNRHPERNGIDHDHIYA